MARIARVVAEGYPHHVTQRGNNCQIVFQDDQDRAIYLAFVKRYSLDYHLAILVYSLMTNHVHFIAIPQKEYSLAKTFDFAHMRYAQYFNKKVGRSGHLWQGRFYSCVLDEPHLIMAARYIERNPVRAKMVKKAWDWKWSSAAYNIGLVKEDTIVKQPFLEYIEESSIDWKKRLEEQDEETFMKAIKTHSSKGLPFGTDGFIDKLERALGRKLRANPVGRPWNKKNN